MPWCPRRSGQPQNAKIEQIRDRLPWDTRFMKSSLLGWEAAPSNIAIRWSSIAVSSNFCNIFPLWDCPDLRGHHGGLCEHFWRSGQSKMHTKIARIRDQNRSQYLSVLWWFDLRGCSQRLPWCPRRSGQPQNAKIRTKIDRVYLEINNFFYIYHYFCIFSTSSDGVVVSTIDFWSHWPRFESWCSQLSFLIEDS